MMNTYWLLGHSETETQEMTSLVTKRTPDFAFERNGNLPNTDKSQKESENIADSTISLNECKSWSGSNNELNGSTFRNFLDEKVHFVSSSLEELTSKQFPEVDV